MVTRCHLMGSSAQNIKETSKNKEINYKATCLVLRCCHGIMRAFDCGVRKVLPWGDRISKPVSNAALNQNLGLKPHQCRTTFIKLVQPLPAADDSSVRGVGPTWCCWVWLLLLMADLSIRLCSSWTM